MLTTAFCDSASVGLLRLILSPKVAPTSVEALNITSPFAFAVPLSVHRYLAHAPNWF